jgi:8-oxo-dGTP diphosphatase
MERFKLVSAVDLLLIKDNKVLLSRRFNTGYEDGTYSLPAGHLDGGETVTQTTVREAKEEIGIVIDPKDLKVVHTMHRITAQGERICFFLTTEKWQGEPTIMEPDKCDGLGWFDLDNLPSNTIPYIRFVIDCLGINTYEQQCY